MAARLESTLIFRKSSGMRGLAGRRTSESRTAMSAVGQ